MKVLVTGANGFVGSALCSHMICLGHEVVPAVRRPSGIAGECIIYDESSWVSALNGCDAVVHCAARAHVMSDESSDPLREYRRVNVDGTVNLAHQAAAAGIKRFVFLSSIKVNGESTKTSQTFRPDDVPTPEDPYGVSKFEAEQALIQIAAETGMGVVIIRPPLVYGPRVKGNFASLVRWLRKGVPLPLGAVHNQRSLVALDNLVDFITLCADPECSPRAANEVFLISDGEDVSTSDLLRKVAKAYGVASRLIPVPGRLLSMAAGLLGKGAAADRLLGSLVVDSSKTRELLGWSPVISMDEQLQEMAKYDALV